MSPLVKTGGETVERLVDAYGAAERDVEHNAHTATKRDYERIWARKCAARQALLDAIALAPQGAAPVVPEELVWLSEAATRGPWNLMHRIPTNVIGDKAYRVARCDFDGDFDHPEAIPNGKLIAAAVNLVRDLIAQQSASPAEPRPEG